MSRTEDFDSELWSDPDVAELTTTARYLYIWTWTNTRCNMSGLYRVTRALITAETGLAAQEIDQAFEELAAARFAFYDGRVLWVRSRVKRLRTKSEQIAKSIANHLEKAPAGHPYVDAFLEEYSGSEWVMRWVREKLTHTSTEPHKNIDVPSQSVSLTGASAEAPRDGQGQGQGGSGGKKRTRPAPPDPDELPADLPDALRVVAPAVRDTLQRVATAKGAQPITLAAVGRALAANPRHEHIRIAGEFEHYWVHGQGAGRSQRDVVAAYRNRLHALPALAAVPLPPANVLELRQPDGPVLSHADQINARAAARRAQAEGDA